MAPWRPRSANLLDSALPAANWVDRELFLAKSDHSHGAHLCPLVSSANRGVIDFMYFDTSAIPSAKSKISLSQICPLNCKDLYEIQRRTR